MVLVCDFEVIEKFKVKYQKVIEDLAPLISSIVPYIPKRRARKLHVGLFGYSRTVIDGVTLPRAITFAAALYSLAIPPEFIGLEVLNDLSEEEMKVLKNNYVNFSADLSEAAKYLSWQNVNMLMGMFKEVSKRAKIEESKLSSGLTHFLLDINTAQDNLGIKFGPRTLNQRKYENAVNNFLICYLQEQDEEAKYNIKEAAQLRRSLG